MTDATALTLRRPRPARALISLVAMIDVLLILLVFFMVTSTYLDLDMIPAVSQDGEASSGTTETATAQPLLVRIGADGAAQTREYKARITDYLDETGESELSLELWEGGRGLTLGRPFEGRLKPSSGRSRGR